MLSMRSAPRSAMFAPFRRPVARGRDPDKDRSADIFAIVARVSIFVEKLFSVCSSRRRPQETSLRPLAGNCVTLVFFPNEATRSNCHAAPRHGLAGGIECTGHRN